MIDKKSLLYFVGGFVVGCVSGYLLVSRRNTEPSITKGDKMFDKNIDEKYKRAVVKDGCLGGTVERRQNASVRPVEAPRRRFTPEMAESIDRTRKARTMGESVAAGYADDIASSNEDVYDIAKKLATEAPVEEAGAEKIEDDVAWADKMTRRANEYRGRRPRIISADALGDLDATWDVKTLYYYAYDETLATEDGELIDDIGLTVGDALEKYGFADDASQREIIVQNFDFSTVYEIEKVLGEYDAGLY